MQGHLWERSPWKTCIAIYVEGQSPWDRGFICGILCVRGGGADGFDEDVILVNL